MSEAAAELTTDLPEISSQASQAIESWRRIIRQTTGDKRTNFERACIELIRLAREETPQGWQVIIDHLHDMATEALIDHDDAQAIFARAAKAPADSPAVIQPHRVNGRNAGTVSIDEEPQPAMSAEEHGPAGSAADHPNKAPLILPPLTIGEWLSRDLPAPDFILGDWLSTTTRGLLVGPTGLGKTSLALALALHIAAGRDFLHWRGRRHGKVLYIDGEMSRTLFKTRIADAVARLGDHPIGFHALSHEDVEGFAPLNTAAGQNYIERLIEQIGNPDLIIFDSIMCLLIGDMKEAEPWAQVMPWVRSITRRRIGQLWAHHTGHDESRSYGDKTKEWQLDTVMHMEAIDREDTDVSFSLEFRKARERTPATRADFQTARIALIGDQWTVESPALAPPGHVSPLGLKFLTALHNALASDGAEQHHGRRAVSLEAWRTECVALGLLEIERDKPIPNNVRALFSKHRRELIATNHIACDEGHAWLIK